MVNAGDPDHPVFVAADHRETERALGGSGLTFTMLRANIYTEVLLGSLVPAVAGGVYASNAGDGATAYVARDDLAAVAAGVLAEGGHEGERLDVTGPAAVTGTDIAAITSDVAGTPVRHQPISDAEAVAGLVAAGLPEAVAGSVSTFGRATREGWFDVVSDAVERVAGRKPTPIADVLSANRSMLVGG
jgi:NAD(P)H dehydrogenase (quinone)